VLHFRIEAAKGLTWFKRKGETVSELLYVASGLASNVELNLLSTAGMKRIVREDRLPAENGVRSNAYAAAVSEPNFL